MTALSRDEWTVLSQPGFAETMLEASGPYYDDESVEAIHSAFKVVQAVRSLTWHDVHILREGARVGLFPGLHRAKLESLADLLEKLLPPR